MTNTIKLKRGSGSDPSASDMVVGEPVLRSDTAELFFKRDDGSVAKVSGSNNVNFEYLELRNAANDGAASYPNADFTLVTSGTTTAIQPAAANTVLVSVNGVIQKPNTGTSTPSAGFALNGSTIKFGGNLSAAPDFILYQEAGGIGEPSDETVSEAKLKVSNNPVNGYVLTAQSGNTGGLTWAAASGGGGDYVHISTTDISSATGSVEITLPTGYDRFEFMYDFYSSGRAHLYMQFSEDDGSNYLVNAYRVVSQNNSYSYSITYTNATYSGPVMADRSKYMTGSIKIFRASETSATRFISFASGFDGASYAGSIQSASGMSTAQTARINKVKFVASGSYTFDSGKIALYGIKDS